MALPYANTECLKIFLTGMASRRPDGRIAMALDGAGRHRGERLKGPENMRLLSLPAYSPKLNPVENIWEEAREKGFRDMVFAGLEDLGGQLAAEMKRLEDSPHITKSISSWDWIINAIPK